MFVCFLTTHIYLHSEFAKCLINEYLTAMQMYLHALFPNVSYAHGINFAFESWLKLQT